MERLNIHSINYFKIAILLFLMSFVSFSSAMEGSFLTIDQKNIHLSSLVELNSSVHLQNIQCHKHNHANNCHNGIHHCGLAQTEFITSIFERKELISHYKSFLPNIYIDVPLHPPR